MKNNPTTWQPLLKETDFCGLYLFFPSFPPKNTNHLTTLLTELERRGYHGTKYMPPRPHGVYANTHALRAQDLANAIQDDNVRVIWAFAGGAGCTQIVEHLERTAATPPASAHPKLLVGFSDTTALMALWQSWGWPVLHAPCAGLLKESLGKQAGINEEASIDQTLAILGGKATHVRYDLRVLHATAPARLSGILTGGNLTLVKETIGTCSSLAGAGHFLFLENALPTDACYLAREIAYLCRAQLITSSTTALLFGQLNIPKETESDFVADIRESFKNYGLDLPIFQSDRFGHGSHNDPLPFGQEAILTRLDTSATLTIETGAAPTASQAGS